MCTINIVRPKALDTNKQTGLELVGSPCCCLQAFEYLSGIYSNYEIWFVSGTDYVVRFVKWSGCLVTSCEGVRDVTSLLSKLVFLKLCSVVNIDEALVWNRHKAPFYRFTRSLHFRLFQLHRLLLSARIDFGIQTQHSFVSPFRILQYNSMWHTIVVRAIVFFLSLCNVLHTVSLVKWYETRGPSSYRT